jgi:hypothetical protein
VGQRAVIEGKSHKIFTKKLRRKLKWTPSVGPLGPVS